MFVSVMDWQSGFGLFRNGSDRFVKAGYYMRAMLGSGEVRLLRRDVARIGKTGCRVEWLARRGALSFGSLC